MYNNVLDWVSFFVTLFTWFWAVVPNFFGTRGQFCGRKFSHRQGGGGHGFKMIQTHYISCAHYFYYELHLRLSGIRTQVLGTFNLGELLKFNNLK